MSRIPEWQYPLYKKSDKIAYLLLKELVRSEKYPKIVGSKEEIDNFLRLSILSQKMKDYRRFRDIVLDEFKKQKVVIKNMLDKGSDIKISEGIDNSWAIFIQDKRICELIDQIKKAKLNFKGNNNEIVEFIVRFWLSQLLFDWRGPLVAVIQECLQNRNVNLKKLNNLLKIWDYTKLFQK